MAMTMDEALALLLPWHRTVLKQARYPATEQMLPVPAQLSNLASRGLRSLIMFPRLRGNDARIADRSAPVALDHGP
jgi:hypothetical protein